MLLGIKSYAQEFYISTFDLPTYKNTIKHIDANLNATSLFDITGYAIFDIAYAPTGKLYGTISNAIMEIDLQNQSFTFVYDFPITGIYNSLVCNSDNEIIVLEYNSQRLITIDLTTLTEVSNVPVGESSPGDLTFYKGNLIFQSVASNNILSFDGINKKTVACGDENILLFGLSNYTDACDNNFVYGFTEDGFVYRYFIETNTYEAVGQINEENSAPIYGATSINENTASACPMLNMEVVDCNLSVVDQELSNLVLYPNPVSDILHIQNINMNEQLFFTLYSLEGRKLTDKLLTPEMDFSQVSSGIYFMEIYNRSKTISITKKIMKK